MEGVDRLELCDRLSRLRLSLTIKTPRLSPDYENEPGFTSSASSTVHFAPELDSGFASPALLASPPHSPSPGQRTSRTPRTPRTPSPSHSSVLREELPQSCKEIATTENGDLQTPCATNPPGRRPPLFSVSSQDCSSTCSMVSLNIPHSIKASPNPSLPTTTRAPSTPSPPSSLSTTPPPPPVPPRLQQKSSPPPILPPKPKRQ